jgi:hypothetical protein
MPTTKRTAITNADQKLVDGLTKHKAQIAALPIGGKTINPLRSSSSRDQERGRISSP